MNSSINPKLKNSYENIFSEFDRMEKTTNDIFLMNKNNEYKRKTRIKMLEMKLQNLCEDVKNFNILDVSKKLEDVTVTKSEGKFLENCAGINSNYSNYLKVLHSNENFDPNPVCADNSRNTLNNKEKSELFQYDNESGIKFKNLNYENFSTPSSNSNKVCY